jgi:ATP-dependent RNA helicase RhlE
MLFTELGLRTELLRALTDAGYTVPTPIQAQAIPVVLTGGDVLAAAQTGTGKTAGFTLPLLQRLAAGTAARTSGPRPIRALILTPTRELAAQVEESVQTYGKHLSLKSTVVFGGVNINPQMQRLRAGVDILVATPGRLLDHVGQRTVDLSRVEILVLDEADRMLDMGFIRDIRRILGLLPARRQNLLFSATFSDEIAALADGLLNSPVRIEVARRNAESELVTQCCYATLKDRKRDLLEHLLATENITQALVFTRTKHGADRLAKQLGQSGIRAAAIHGNRSQPQRIKALADFKAGAARVLVATDIAARGLDIDQLPHVVNFELPNIPEDYVHRIGRTGRAGSPGTAISLVSEDETAYLGAIERLIQKRIERRSAPGLTVTLPETSLTPSRTRTTSRPQSARGPRPQPAGAGGRSAPRPYRESRGGDTNRAGTPAPARRWPTTAARSRPEPRD